MEAYQCLMVLVSLPTLDLPSLPHLEVGNYLFISDFSIIISTPDLLRIRSRMEKQAPKCTSCRNPSYIACSACGHRTPLVFNTGLPPKGYEKHYQNPPERCPREKSGLSLKTLDDELPKKRGAGSHGNQTARLTWLLENNWVTLHPCQCILRRYAGLATNIYPQPAPPAEPSWPALSTSLVPQGPYPSLAIMVLCNPAQEIDHRVCNPPNLFHSTLLQSVNFNSSLSTGGAMQKTRKRWISQRWQGETEFFALCSSSNRVTQKVPKETSPK